MADDSNANVVLVKGILYQNIACQHGIHVFSLDVLGDLLLFIYFSVILAVYMYIRDSSRCFHLYGQSCKSFVRNEPVGYTPLFNFIDS